MAPPGGDADIAAYGSQRWATADPQLSSLLKDIEPELILGVVAPLGADTADLESSLAEIFAEFGYVLETIRVSRLLRELDLKTVLVESPEYERVRSYMDAGNEVRRRQERNDILALLAVAKISDLRTTLDPEKPRVFLLSSFKTPDEVHLLRECYGPAFFLIGSFASESERLDHLRLHQGMTADQALELTRRDQEEEDPRGQKLRRVFQLADVFVPAFGARARPALERFVDLLFAKPCVTPVSEEMSMFFAYASSMRSGDLSRQVGASLVARTADLLSVGVNDVPKAGGGLYWPGTGDARDHVRGFDSNRAEIYVISEQIIKSLIKAGCVDARDTDDVRACLTMSALGNLTEYGRAVHAEMDVLLAASRNGVSAAGNCLFTTTFPCHNCAKHIITAGVHEVIFVEPYPKSHALDLHGDAIVDIDSACATDKVKFRHFVGVAPRRFFDLFSMGLSDSFPVKRQIKGKLIPWSRATASPRLPSIRSDRRSHIQVEKLLVDALALWIKREEQTGGD